MKLKSLITLSIVYLAGQVTFAQQTTSTENNFSLAQCIEFAIANHSSIKSAKLDEQIAAAKVGEVRAAGLPQANLNGTFIKTLDVQKMYAPANAFDKTAPANMIIPLGFGVPYSSSGSAAITQLIFSGQYLIGLQAAKTYIELSSINSESTRATLIQNVTKAYYLNLVNQERKELFYANLNRLDSILKQTRASFNAGFVEGIEVNRLEVTYNNILVEKQKVDNLLELGNYALKFQMGMKLTDGLKLTDKLNTYQISSNTTNAEINYLNIPMYKSLITSKKLNELDLKANKAGYLPTLAAFGNVGYNNGAISVSNLFSSKWNPYSNLGVSLNIPVFDGFQKCYKIQQSKLNIEKLNTVITNAEQGLSLQAKSAEINLKNSLQSLDNQKNNMVLAKEVTRVSEIKYKQGVGSSLEIVTAESALKEAQINYYNSLYDVLVYKVDLDYALGNLK